MTNELEKHKQSLINQCRALFKIIHADERIAFKKALFNENRYCELCGLEFYKNDNYCYCDHDE